MRAYRADKPEEKNAAKRARRARNQEAYVARSREWYALNKERVRKEFAQKMATDKVAKANKLANEHKYRAAKIAAGTFTGEEWKALCDAVGNICLCCGEAKKLTVDHIVPISKGGANTIDNLQPLCKSCNSSKKAKIVDYRPKDLNAN